MAAIYKLTPNIDVVFRRTDRLYIPSDPSNTDWQEYLAWLAAGNTPDPVNPLPASIANRTQTTKKK